MSNVSAQTTVAARPKIPSQIKGAEAIGAVFGVSRKTVRQWALDGAPIMYVGRCYQANYARLCLWLETQYTAAGRKRDDAAPLA